MAGRHRLGLVGLIAAAAVVPAGCGITMTMPGSSYAGPPPAASAAETATATALERDVRRLAESIGERNTRRPKALHAAAEYLEAELLAIGYRGRRYVFDAGGVRCANLEVTVPGTTHADEVVVVGAHYDSAPGTAGANDNAAGVAALLELARRFAGRPAPRTLRLVFFVNEEPPWFRGPWMGSRIYARHLKAEDARVVAMLSFDTIGYFNDADDSQDYPFPFSLFYPSTGNFLAFVANPESTPLLERVVRVFRSVARLPSEGVGAPASLPGIDWSDQMGFWEVGYPAVMVTDTAPNRYPYYHTADDTAGRVDYRRLALAVDGLESVIVDLLTDWLGRTASPAGSLFAGPF